jgi:hypothetical protein
MKLKDIHIILEDIFHGNEKTGIVSQVQQVIGGYYPFDALYTQQTDIVTAPTVEETSTNINKLILKKDLTQSETVIVAGRDITQKLLECTFLSKPELIRGRKLYNDAKVALRNIRKALAILKDLPEVLFVDYKIQFCSGVSLDEVKIKLRDGMYDLINNSSINLTLDDSDDECNGEENNSIVSNRRSTKTTVWVVFSRVDGLCYFRPVRIREGLLGSYLDRGPPGRGEGYISSYFAKRGSCKEGFATISTP